MGSNICRGCSCCTVETCGGAADLGLHDDIIGLGFGVEDDALAAVEVADDGALELAGRAHVHGHDGLQDDGRRAHERLPECVLARQLECHLTAVHCMRCPIRQRHPHTLR